ncbi:protein of unknown function [Vibrio tapetis subsp. tapetis]|uniref:Uncharacterized protein n=1 Tax=Vibrio tapetis subsp. tapetis TaxID=1671868 RepID=A0A2N8ZID6_9VIBR|nr:protein of unknown function [Vibrio tapetis subsp. tapetis]
MTDCRSLVDIDIAHNANTAPLVIAAAPKTKAATNTLLYDHLYLAISTENTR